MGYANTAVLALLGSPAGLLLDEKICALKYVGRRTGRTIVLPVQYARTDGGVLIAVGRPERKTWWRNMSEPRSVEIWLDGAWHPATAHVVAPHARSAAFQEYSRTFPHIPAGVPVVQVALQQAEQVLPLRGRKLLRTWIAWVTAGEATGFAVPAIAGAVAASASSFVSVPVLLAAGAVEGAVLGAAQAHVLRAAVPGIPGRRWTAVTSGAAVIAYLLGLLPSTVASHWSTPAVITLAIVAGTGLLLSIGWAQWTVLRRHVGHAAWWIAITAGGWLAGLTVFLLVAMPLWQPGQPLWLIVTIGVVAGVLMATTVALLTGLGLRRLLGE
jgi:deazaflavin-dependent oxidoreductase (nitroreductase family)